MKTITKDPPSDLLTNPKELLEVNNEWYHKDELKRMSKEHLIILDKSFRELTRYYVILSNCTKIKSIFNEPCQKRTTIVEHVSGELIHVKI